MNSAPEKNLETPPESDPRKENRNISAGGEASFGPEDFDDILTKDDGTVQQMNQETPGLTEN